MLNSKSGKAVISMKVLYILSYLSKNGGVQSVVNNYYNNLSKDIEVDFLTLLPGDEEFEQELEKKGSKVYHIGGSKEKNLFIFLKEIKKFFREHHDYDILHNHQTNLDLFYLKEAKKWKIPVRIMHAHNTNCDISKLRMKILKLTSKRYANYYFACSEEAGKFMFGKNIINNKRFYVINNAIDVEKYEYNEEIRNKVQNQIKMNDNFVVGNVSRMTEIKNHKFLIEIFNEILKITNNAKLLLVGDGPLKEELIEKVKILQIEDKVVFYGTTNKVHEVLQAMDVFILPSLFEGVPVTIVEAAASGIKYVISDTIDSHLKENELELKLNLNLSAKEWADKIIEFSMKYQRKKQKELLVASKFDIKKETEKLEEIYVRALEGKKDNEK